MTIPRPLFITLFSLASGLLVGQAVSSPPTTPQLIYNRSGAPLVLSAESNRDYSIDNVSNDRIVSYRLGCIRVSKRGVNITKSMDAETVDWPKGSGVSVLRTAQTGPLVSCKAINSQLSVVEVRFGDGRTWKISGP
jgi:hypothetical protein